MNDNARKWVEALESGRFKQGRSYLHRIDDQEEHFYCCLGVACALAAEEGVAEVQDLLAGSSLDPARAVGYDRSLYDLPSSVQRWLGMHDSRGDFRVSEPVTAANGERCASLVSLNDRGGASFEEIAQVIKGRSDQLFED